MDNKNKTLAEQILDGDLSNLEERLKAAPYSQPLQRLAAAKGLANNYALLSYNRQDLVDKVDTSYDTRALANVTLEESSEIAADKKAAPKKKSKKKSPTKQKNSKKVKGKSEFSSWLVLCAPLPGTEITKKVSKKKKKRKKKTKTKLDKNIHGSVREKEEIASEALAKLYAAQGHNKKALKMYEKLSLINPQKSSFFEPLIENLKNKLQ